MQQEPIEATRLLALHVRPQRFGFAVLKGPRQLLDWGESTYLPQSGKTAAQVSKRVDPLLRIYGPSVVVVRKLTKRDRRRYDDLRPILSVMKYHAAQHSAHFVLMGREEVRQAFQRFGKVTKYHIAAQVAVFFPELLWKLPPPRKPWQTEHRNMAIFDAAALGIAYFGRFGGFGMHLEDASIASAPAS